MWARAALVVYASLLSGCSVVLTASNEKLCEGESPNGLVKAWDYQPQPLSPLDVRGADAVLLNKLTTSHPWVAESPLRSRTPITADRLERIRTALVGTRGLLEDKTASVSSDKFLLVSLARHIPWILEYEGLTGLPSSFVGAGDDARRHVYRLATIGKPGAVAYDARYFSGAFAQSDVFAFSKADAALVEDVSRAVATYGYDAMTLNALGEILEILREKPQSQEAINQLKAAISEFNIGRFAAQYFRSYFRGGRIIQVSLNQSAMAGRLTDSIAERISAKQEVKAIIGEEVTKVLGKACREQPEDKSTCLLTSALGDEAFVTRAGLEVQFSGITAVFGTGSNFKPEATLPEAADYAPQLVRVALEAVFDAQGLRVPAAANSTACVKGMYAGPKECLSDAAATPVNPGTIAKVDQYSSQAESVTAGVTGQLVRGVWALALNNDAVANSVETLAGVSARKFTEKVIWRKLSDPSCSAAFPGYSISAK